MPAVNPENMRGGHPKGGRTKKVGARRLGATNGGGPSRGNLLLFLVVFEASVHLEFSGEAAEVSQDGPKSKRALKCMFLAPAFQKLKSATKFNLKTPPHQKRAT